MSQPLLDTLQISITIYDGLQRFLELLICSQEILVVVSTAKGAVVHQLKSNMYGDTVILRQHIPTFLDMLNNTFKLNQSRKHTLHQDV